MKTRQRTELMGKIVTVTKILARQEPGNRRAWISIETSGGRAGWVVGFRTLQNGTVKDSGDWMRYLEISSTVPCVLVAYWHNLRPIQIPFDGYRLGGKPYAVRRYSYEASMLKAISEDMRAVMKGWPRNKRGHWLKWDDMTTEQKAHQGKVYFEELPSLQEGK